MKSMKIPPIVVTTIASIAIVALAPTPKSFAYSPQFATPLSPAIRVQISPDAMALFKQAEQQQEQEDFAGAISSYTEFLKLHPNYTLAYSNRGFARAMTDDLRGALKDFDRAIALAPNNADHYNARGNVRAMTGNLAASIRDFNRSIRCDRNFADAYYNRAISKHGLGDKRGARSDFDRAAKLYQQQQDPSGYQQARDWIDKLK
jgi:tetratricopeptide (TPR) repeat protein